MGENLVAADFWDHLIVYLDCKSIVFKIHQKDKILNNIYILPYNHLHRAYEHIFILFYNFHKNLNKPWLCWAKLKIIRIRDCLSCLNRITRKQAEQSNELSDGQWTIK